MSDGFQRVSEDSLIPWDALYNRYSSWFKSRLIRRYGIEEAEDIAQETWLRFGPYQGRTEVAHPRALLLRIAANLAANGKAREVRRDRHVQELAQTGVGEGEQPRQDEEVLARQLVQSLPEPLRDVFVLSRFVGMTNAQIGERLGLSTKTVEWRMTKALAHCAAQLRR